MASEISAFSQAKLSKALRGATKAGLVVSRAVIFSDRIELEFAENYYPSLDDDHMTEANLLAGLEALGAAAPRA